MISSSDSDDSFPLSPELSDASSIDADDVFQLSCSDSSDSVSAFNDHLKYGDDDDNDDIDKEKEKDYEYKVEEGDFDSDIDYPEYIPYKTSQKPLQSTFKYMMRRHRFYRCPINLPKFNDLVLNKLDLNSNHFISIQFLLFNKNQAEFQTVDCVFCVNGQEYKTKIPLFLGINQRYDIEFDEKTVTLNEDKDIKEIISTEIMPLFSQQSVEINEENYNIFRIFGEKLNFLNLVNLSNIVSDFIKQRDQMEKIIKIASSAVFNIIYNSENNIASQTYKLIKAIKKKKIDLEVIVNLLYVCSYTRPFYNDHLIRIIVALVGHSLEFKDMFAKKLLYNIMNENNQNFYFLHEIMLNNVIEKDMLLDSISSLNYSIKAAFWFAPYFKNRNSNDGNDEYKELWEDLVDSIKSLKDHSLSTNLLQFLDLVSKDDWKMHKVFTKMGHSSNPLLEIIRKDDLDAFRKDYVSSASFNIRTTINDEIHGIFERSTFLSHSPCLIHYAAYFGAIKIFKYLLLQDVSNLFDKDSRGFDVSDYAIAGTANTEIIHLYFENKRDNLIRFSLLTAVSFHQYDIYNWIKEKYFSSDNTDPDKNIVEQRNREKILQSCLLESCQQFNFPVFFDLFHNIKNVACIHIAARNNNLDVVKMFKSFLCGPYDASILVDIAFTGNIGQYDYLINEVIPKKYAAKATKSALLNSMKRDHLPLFKHIIRCSLENKVDNKENANLFVGKCLLNVQGQNGYYLFGLACLAGAIKIVRYLINDFNSEDMENEEKFDANLEINKKKEGLFRRIIEKDRFKIVRELLKLPNLDIGLKNDKNGTAFTYSTWMNLINITKLLYSYNQKYINNKAKNKNNNNENKADNDKDIYSYLNIKDSSYQNIGIDVNNVGAIGHTPLTGCSEKNLIYMAEYLLSLNEIDINRPSIENNTAFEISLKKSHSKVALALLRSSKNITFDTKNALVAAMKINSPELTNEIINHKNCDLNKIFEVVNLAIASSNGKFVAEVLRNPRFLQSDKSIEQNIKYVIRLSDTNLYRLLFNNFDIITDEKDSDFNRETNMYINYFLKNENTLLPLHNAVLQNKHDCLKYLISTKKLNPNLQNQNGETPFLLSIKMNFSECLSTFISLINDKNASNNDQYIIDINLPDNTMHSPFYELIKSIIKYRDDIISLLIGTGRVNFNVHPKNETIIDLLYQEELYQLVKCVLLSSSEKFDVNQKIRFSPLDHSIKNHDEINFEYIMNHKDCIVGTSFVLCIMSSFDRAFDKMLNHSSLDINIVFHDDEKQFSTTALMESVKNNKIELTKSILQKENIQPDLELNGISAVSCCKNNEMLELLLQNGCEKVNCWDFNGITPLFYSIQMKDQKMFDKLMSLSFIDINKKNKDGQVPIFAACSLKNDAYCLKKLLSNKELDLRNLSDSVDSPLSVAISYQNYELTTKLIELGEEVDSSALSSAILNQWDFDYITKFLLPSNKMINGFYPIEKLMSYGNNFSANTCFKILLNKTDFSLTSNVGTYCLYTCVSLRMNDIVEEILKSKDNVLINWQNPKENKKTALMEALKNGDDKIALMLLDYKGIDVDVVDKKNDSCFKYLLENMDQYDKYSPNKTTCQQYLTLMTKILQKSIKNLNALMSNGETPLTYLALNNKPLIIKFLMINENFTSKNGNNDENERKQKHLLDLNKENTKGFNALDIAITHYYDKIVHILVKDPEFVLNNAPLMCVEYERYKYLSEMIGHKYFNFHQINVFNNSSVNSPSITFTDSTLSAEELCKETILERILERLTSKKPLTTSVYLNPLTTQQEILFLVKIFDKLDYNMKIRADSEMTVFGYLIEHRINFEMFTNQYKLEDFKMKVVKKHFDYSKMIENGADPNIESNGILPIVIALNINNTDALMAILACEKTDLELRCSKGNKENAEEAALKNENEEAAHLIRFILNSNKKNKK